MSFPTYTVSSSSSCCFYKIISIYPDYYICDCPYYKNYCKNTEYICKHIEKIKNTKESEYNNEIFYQLEEIKIDEEKAPTFNKIINEFIDDEFDIFKRIKMKLRKVSVEDEIVLLNTKIISIEMLNEIIDKLGIKIKKVIDALHDKFKSKLEKYH